MDRPFSRQATRILVLESDLDPERVLRHLTTADAFDEILKPRVARREIELKIAEVCFDYLTMLQAGLRHGEGILDSRSLWHEQFRGYSRIASILWKIDPDPRDRLRFEEKAKRVGEKLARFNQVYPVDRQRNTRERQGQKARILNQLTIDLIAILRHTTSMTLTEIEGRFLPEVLKALGQSFQEFLPRGGLKAPHARAKRYLERALRCYRSEGVMTRRDVLLQKRAAFLFKNDSRFPPDLFRPRPARTALVR